MKKLDNFLKMLEGGNDNALLRYSIGNEYYNGKDYTQAIPHLEKAVELNPDYSAAWKLYGKALTEAGENQTAMNAYQKGIEVAEKNGDIQAVKEMNVFLKRLQK